MAPQSSYYFLCTSIVINFFQFFNFQIFLYSLRKKTVSFVYIVAKILFYVFFLLSLIAFFFFKTVTIPPPLPALILKTEVMEP